jgi:hypothetical protein
MKYPVPVFLALGIAWVAMLGFIGPWLVSADNTLMVLSALVVVAGLLWVTAIATNKYLDDQFAKAKAESKDLDQQFLDFAVRNHRANCGGCVTCEALDQAADQRGETEQPSINNTREG